LSGPKADGSSFQINGQAAFDHIKELVIVIVFVPMVLALDHANADNRGVDLAKRLIEPRDLGVGESFLIDDLQCSVQDIESRIVGEIFNLAHCSTF